jgi:hypothetical protein
VEVISIAAILLCGVILGDATSRIMLRQMVIWIGRQHSLTLDTPCPIVVADRRFPLRNADRLLRDDKVCLLSPLLSQDTKGGAIGHHALDGFYNILDSDGTEVRI